MPRSNRHFIAGQVWHITQRCHQKHFLLKFQADRRRWLLPERAVYAGLLWATRNHGHG